jgi:hypothetical protein
MTETSIRILKNGVRPSFYTQDNTTSTTEKHIMCITIKKYMREEYATAELSYLSGLIKRKVKSLNWFFDRVDYNVGVKIKSYKRIANIHDMIMNNEYDKAVVEMFR